MVEAGSRKRRFASNVGFSPVITGGMSMQDKARKLVFIRFFAFIPSVVYLLAAAPLVCADNRVIGTVDMRVDGSEQTWYILQPPGGLPPTALWLPMGPGTVALSIGAYPDRDTRFVEDATTGSPVPAGATPVLVLLIGFATGAERVRYELPLTAEEGPAAIIMQPDWRDYTAMFEMSEAPGEITLDRIEANKSGDSAFAGTFTGEYRGRDGSVRQVTHGRFQVTGARYFAGKPAAQGER
jgi:hypothetical protein